MDKIKRILSFCLMPAVLLSVSCGKTVPAEQSISIVPLPASVTDADGNFTLKAMTPVVQTFGDERMTYAVDFWNGVANELFGRNVETIYGESPHKKAINIVQDASMEDEQYRLKVDASGIDIAANGPEGIFYAFQTLRQLLPASAFAGDGARIEIPACEINDKPYFAYRGFMFDMGRHIFSVDEVKDMLDILAMHKINKFHWHLTEDQGWRIEIRKYPYLTEVGSIRKSSPTGRNRGQDGKPYGGFFTQAEVRDIVQYAAERFITVIPEIEIPGHSAAALAAYPDLGCTGGQYEVATWWGVDEHVICPGKESSFTFLEDVLTEVMELFPSEYIHIGGDECPKTFWKKCPACQRRIRHEGLKDETELQAYVTKRIEKFLDGHGRRIIGWDEILEGGMTQSATVMAWRGPGYGIRAAKLGNRVIMSPNSNCNLDYYQSRDVEDEPLAIGGYIPLETAYALDPYSHLNDEERKFILGVQGNLWTEYIDNYEYAQYMALPRLSAIAEVGWSYDRKDYGSFLKRMIHITRLFDHYGYNYCRHEFETAYADNGIQTK